MGFVLAISIYCLPAGFLSGRTVFYAEVAPGTNAAGTAMFAGIAVLLIVVAVLSIAFVKPDRDDFVYRMIVPLMAAGLLLMPLVPDVAESVTQIAIMGGYIILEMFAWSMLQGIAQVTGMHPAFVFGIGKTGMNLGLLVGCILGMYSMSQSTVIALGVSVAIVYAFILMGSFWLTGRKGGLLLIFSQRERTGSDVVPGKGLASVSASSDGSVNLTGLDVGPAADQLLTVTVTPEEARRPMPCPRASAWSFSTRRGSATADVVRA